MCLFLAQWTAQLRTLRSSKNKTKDLSFINNKTNYEVTPPVFKRKNIGTQNSDIHVHAGVRTMFRSFPSVSMSMSMSLSRSMPLSA
jgi:hypothetical protein